VSDETVNQTARRVAIHQAINGIVDARRRLFERAETPVDATEALVDALDHLATNLLNGPPAAVEHAWRAIAAIAQGQLEQAMEERAR
jgi:enoyl-CoA hydratase/carnithine racemase